MPISVNDSVKDAAAKTFNVIGTGEGVGVGVLLVVVEPPQAANNMQKLSNNKNKRKDRFMGPPREVINIPTISVSEYL
jgi:3-methyladenine DNA glycosylase Mpg